MAPTWGQKSGESGLKYCSYKSKCMVYNKVWFSRSTFNEKAKKIDLQTASFLCWSKTLSLAKNLHFVALLARSSEMLDFFGGWHFLDIL